MRARRLSVKYTQVRSIYSSRHRSRRSPLAVVGDVLSELLEILTRHHGEEIGERVKLSDSYGEKCSAC
jgi:hypothetical protein